MRVKTDDLVERGACRSYVDTFHRLFPTSGHPDGVEVTEELCVKHHDRFDWSWAASCLLTSDGYQLFCERVDVMMTEWHEKRQRHERVAAAIFNDGRTTWREKWNVEDADHRFSDEAQAEWARFADAYQRARTELDSVDSRAFARLFAELSATHQLDVFVERERKLAERVGVAEATS